MADTGQRDYLSSSVGKLDCVRGYRWTCVDRFRRITPGLSKVGERQIDPYEGVILGGWGHYAHNAEGVGNAPCPTNCPTGT